MNFKSVQRALLLVALLTSSVLGQVANLQDANHSLTITLSGAPTTTQPNYTVFWDGSGGPADAVGATTGSTAKTVLSGVAGGPRVVQSVQIYNADTVAVTATISKVIS